MTEAVSEDQQDQWVFAYGSNMNLPDLQPWLVKGDAGDGVRKAEAAMLPGHRLVWDYYAPRRRGGAADVEPADNVELPGLALFVSPGALRVIDCKETHPDIYFRERRDIRLRGGQVVSAWVYRVLPAHRSAKPVWPHKDYRDIVVSAARSHGLPDWHIAALEAVPIVTE